jgi:hypothetical protein
MKPTTVLLLVLALVGTAPAIDSLNVRLVGYYLTGSAFGIAVDSEYASIVEFDSPLRLISVADPTRPFEAGQDTTTTFGVNLAMVDTDFVYVPDISVPGVHVISIDSMVDTAHTEVGFLNTPTGVGGIAVAGQYAYMAAGTELLVVSIADPVNPVIVARCGTSGTGVTDVAVSGNYAYVMDYNQGLKVISVADPLHPVEVGHCSLTGMFWRVAVSGSYVCAGALGGVGLSFISVADPANPTVVGSLLLPQDVGGVTMDGDTVYVGAGAAGLRIISIEDPAHPLELGYYYGGGFAGKGVALSRGYIFVAAGSALLILQYYGSGVEESSGPQVLSHRLLPTVIRSLPPGAVAFDATGRRVVNPRAGVYFLRDKGRAAWGGRRNAEGRPAALAAVDGKTGVACRVVAA